MTVRIVEFQEYVVAETSLEQRTVTGDVEHAAAHAVVSYNPDAPSEEWGWHGSWREFAPRGSTIILSLGVVLLLLQNFTVHESHVESFYYNGLALIGAIWIAMRVRSGRRMRQEAANKNA